MRVLAACSLGGAGHLNPLLAFLAAARRNGGETLVVAPPGLRDMVEAAGHAFWPGREPPEEVVAPIRELLPVVAPADASVLANRELFGRLATAAMFEDMQRACARWLPDLILRDPCEYSSAIVASRRGIAVAQVAISLAEGEAGSIKAAGPALEEHREHLTEELLASPYLSQFPTSLDPSPFPTTLRYRRLSELPSPPMPDWWGGVDAPLVYVTFGTVLGYMSMAARVYRTAVDAMEGIGARVLLTLGRKFDASELGPLPSNVHVERWVDHETVMARADVVVCHGGSGTALGALAAGCPLVIVPLFADQFENGRRIATAGAGMILDEARQRLEGARRQLTETDAPRIRELVEGVLADGSFRHRAELLAREMAVTSTVDDVLFGRVPG